METGSSCPYNSPDELEFRAADGHIELRLLADLVAYAEGSFDFRSSPDVGTEVRLELPLS